MESQEINADDLQEPGVSVAFGWALLFFLFYTIPALCAGLAGCGPFRTGEL